MSELPLDYLEWACGVATAPWLREALLAEHQARMNQQSSSTSSQAGDRSSAPDLRELVERSRRELARQHHPDHGGDGQIMRGINALADYLLGKNRRGGRR